MTCWGSTRLTGIVCLLILATAGCDGEASKNEVEDAGTAEDAARDAETAADGGLDGTDADPCLGDLAPTVVGSIADVGFPIGATDAAYMVVLSEPVSLPAGAITVTNGASIGISPALPATASAFMVTLTGLVGGTDYTLTLENGVAVDACNHAVAGPVSVNVVSACHSDTTAPTIVSALDPLELDFDATTQTYALTFDEIVRLDADAIAVNGGGTVTVTPALPASAATFTVEIGGISDAMSYDLTIVAEGIADRCGNELAEDASIALVGACDGDATAPSITSSVEALTLLPGATSITYTLTFDDVVALDADAITADNGAVVTVDPPLPAASDSFEVTLTEVTSAQSYALTVDATHAADRCENALSEGASIDVMGACVGNVAPTITSSALSRQFGGTSYMHVLSFDEPLFVADGAITIDNGASVTAAPPLPSMGPLFSVELSGLVDGTTYEVNIDANGLTDICGAHPSQGQSFTLTGCGGDTTPPVITSAPPPLCAPGGASTYVLELDEITYVPAIAVTDATVTSITPALPAYGRSFEIVLGNVSATTTISLGTDLLGDCGGSPAAAQDVTFAPYIWQTATFDYTGAIVSFAVPESAQCGVVIEAFGAQGGQNTNSVYASGLGARMRGTFTTLPSRDLRVLVGEQPSSNAGNGGGGGSFVVTAGSVPLVIAGGGGGSGATTDGPHKHASESTSGQTCPAIGGAGGTDGNGGTVGASGFQSGAGGGLLTSGANGWTADTGGRSFLLGGAGGSANAPARGGFGGGGSGSSYVVGGGGGGYSGGGGCGNTVNIGQVGAGGGSYNAGTAQDNAGGVRQGNGQVTITY